jgi:serine/threonine protein kinase
MNTHAHTHTQSHSLSLTQPALTPLSPLSSSPHQIHNVMLKSCSGRSSGRGVTAKVSDFGLAIKIDPEQDQTHMSGCFQGTITHMAPELLLSGHMSKAVDVSACMRND